MKFFKQFGWLNYIVLFSVTVFLAIGFMCLGMHHEKATHNDVNTGLSFKIESSCCSNSISEHIQSWKSASLAVPSQVKSLLSLVLLLGFIMLIIMVRGFRTCNVFDHQFNQLQLYAKAFPHHSIFNFLKFVFARGILNSKSF